MALISCPMEHAQYLIHSKHNPVPGSVGPAFLRSLLSIAAVTFASFIFPRPTSTSVPAMMRTMLCMNPLPDTWMVTRRGSSTPRAIDVGKARALVGELGALSLAERVARHGLRPDRADTILPAALILCRVAEAFGLPAIGVPGVGLKEGVLLDLAHTHFGPAGRSAGSDDGLG